MIFKTNIFSIFIILSFTYNSFTGSLNINGLSKLSIEDLQTQTKIDLNKSSYNNIEIDELIKDLYKSDLIYDLNHTSNNGTHYLTIQENKLIENIYINGNIRLDYDIIIQNISSKINQFINKNNIKDDINMIRNIYRAKGFDNVNIIVTSEKYSNDRVNLIFDINENKQSQIERIKFIGNSNFSDRYLLSLINSKSKNFFNIFSSGSNLNIDNFIFDTNRIKLFYRQNGFSKVDINYEIDETSSNRYTITFFINEGDRIKLEDIILDTKTLEINNLVNLKFNKFIKKISKNNNYYNQFIINDFLIDINKLLINNNYYNITYTSKLEQNNNIYKLIFTEKTIVPSTINQINIFGNEITKDKTIRSKLFFEPGDYFNENIIKITKNDLLKYKYINNVNILNEIKDDKSNITIEIDENKKTGQVLAGGTFSGDKGAGITLALKDNNIFGSGNNLDTNFTVNEENALFNISIAHYPIKESKITNKYFIFNKENDLTNSFGYKVKEQGLGYSTIFEYNENIDITTGLNYKKSDRHSASVSAKSINDNIGDFDIYTFNMSLIYDSTNDFLYPTDGSLNSAYIEYSPNEFSDDSYYKIIIKNDLYNKLQNSNRFLFLSNRIGMAESLDGKLKTVNAFSLGGLNFKGFDYRGVGPKQDNRYLGGNKFFTSTIGYGGSFLFDDKDNINTKLFYTLGSIWDSDYTDDNDLELRSSLGLSLDLLTAIGPLSFSYAIPINKKTNDRTNEFNFSIGTSF